jgi:hypothetical protein
MFAAFVALTHSGTCDVVYVVQQRPPHYGRHHALIIDS